MAPVNTFTIRFDERTKQILVSLLDNGIVQTSQAITAGDYSEELLQQHEELVQVKNGILYTRPEGVLESEPNRGSSRCLNKAGYAIVNHSWRS